MLLVDLLPRAAELCTGEWLYFVHGGAVADPSVFERGIDDRGGGEFGRGFYTFALCDESGDANGLTSVIKLARKRISILQPVPCVVYVRILRTTFSQLKQGPAPNWTGPEIYKAYWKYAVSAYDVMVSPLRTAKGHQLMRGYPPQYKFEGKGTRVLSWYKTVVIPEA